MTTSLTTGRPPTTGQRDLVRELLLQEERRSALATIDTCVYTSPERFAAEQRAVFRRLPVPIGPSSMLPEPGTSVVHPHYGVSLLLTRDEHGRLRTLLNSCRHRGAQLVESDEPQRRPRIICPYHAWTYRLDGSLHGLPFPETFACLPTERFGLLSFPTHEAGGMIWAKLDLDGDDDFSSIPDELVADFEALGADRMHLYARRTHSIEANWKFVLDGFQELYHVKVLHANSVAKMFANARTTESAIGHHMRFATARKTYRDLDVDADLAHLQHHVTFSYLLFPNTIVVVSPTFINILVSYPQAADRTLVDDYMLIDKLPDSESEHQHWQKSLELLDDHVYQREDLHAAELQQRGLSSGLLRESVLGGLEVPVRVFHDNLNSHLAQEGTR